MRLETAMRMAVICGMYTVQEAVRNIQYHCTMLFAYTEIDQELKELFDEYEEWNADNKGDKIPEHIIKEENDKLEKYFEEHASSEDVDIKIEKWDFSDSEDKGE